MLSEIERKLTAIVADGLADLTRLRVVEAPEPLQPASPGDGILRVSLSQIQPDSVFVPGEALVSTAGGSPVSRRVLPVGFEALLEFRVLAPDSGTNGLASARSLLLTSMSRAAHLLSTEEIRNGKGFAVAAPDPGFEVQSFEFAEGAVAQEIPAEGPSATLRYRGKAIIWPPGVSGPEGVIRAVDPVIAALPVVIEPDDPVVPAGGGTRVRVRSIPSSRLVNAQNGARGVLRLAVTVQSDLPPGLRGTITNGEAGAIQGFRVIPAGTDETVIDYKAPAGDLGATRMEYVAVHLADPANGTSVFLGAAAIRLVEAS
jgi:hypothetical protein